MKQRGVLSPALFCVYIDSLLSAVCTSRFGCSIDTMFVGIIAMCMLELLMLKHDLLFVPDGDFTASDIDEVIRSMCNDWC